MNKKKITSLHGRIKKLAFGAIARGEIISCARQPDDTYNILRSHELVPTSFTAVGAGSYLYLLNSLALSQEKPD